MSTPLDIVDIHTHLWPADLDASRPAQHPAIQIRDDIIRKIRDPEALVDEFAQAGVSTAVLSTTIEGLFGLDLPVDGNRIRKTNDWLVSLVDRHPERLLAFATIDAFGGEEAAREVERSIDELGLAGIVVDSSRGHRFLSDASAQPVLAAAAARRVPVFVHPIGVSDAGHLIAGAGPLGNSAARGLMNGVAFLSVLHAGILNRHPDLSLIFATLGLGAIVQAARGRLFGRERWARGERPNIYFDTMGHDPRIVRVLVDFFGPERVLAGTDWPILPALQQDSLRQSLSEAALNENDAALVAGGNARRILRTTQS